MATDEQLQADVVCRMEKFEKSVSVKVVGYSLIRKHVTDGKELLVATFDLAGHGWAINITPGLALGNYYLHVSPLT
jgi:speckle-type POZ protein